MELNKWFIEEDTKYTMSRNTAQSVKGLKSMQTRSSALYFWILSSSVQHVYCTNHMHVSDHSTHMQTKTNKTLHLSAAQESQRYPYTLLMLAATVKTVKCKINNRSTSQYSDKNCKNPILKAALNNLSDSVTTRPLDIFSTQCSLKTGQSKKLQHDILRHICGVQF